MQEDVTDVIRTLTGGNGVGRIVEASGAASLLNASFSWLRKVTTADLIAALCIICFFVCNSTP